MATSSYFQGQQPNIDISLFGDASSQGIQAGNAQKTPTQAVIQGLTQGVETGQQIGANYQTAQIRQNQIDQLPAANKIQNEEAAQQEIATKRQNIYLNNEASNAQLKTTADAAKLQDETVQSNTQSEQTQKITELSNQFPTMSAQQQVEALSQNSDIFAKEPKLFDQFVGQSYAAGNLTPDQYQTFQGISEKRKAGTAFDLAAQKSYQNFLTAKDALFKNDMTGEMQQTTGQHDEDLLYNNTRLVDHDSIRADPNGTVPIDPSTNQPYRKYTGPDEMNPARNNAGKITSYDAIYTDPVTGDQKISKYNVDVDKAALFHKYYAQKSKQDPSLGLASQYRSIDKKYAPQNPPQEQEPISTFDSQNSSSKYTPAPTKEEVSPQVTFRQNVAKQTLNLSDDQVQKLDPSLEKLQTFASTIVNSSDRNSAALQGQRKELIKTTAREISDSNFDANPVLETQYNQGRVDTYNKNLITQLGVNNSTTVRAAKNIAVHLGIDGISKETQQVYFSAKQQYLNNVPENSQVEESMYYDINAGTRINIQPFLVQSPKDLYYINNKDNLEQGVSDTFVKYGQTYVQAKNSAPKEVVAGQKNFNILRNNL